MATDITFDEFVELVRQMRYNQRRYARLKKPEVKATLDKMENDVDAVISAKTSTQIKLFDDGRNTEN